MTTSYRFALLAVSVSAVMALSACQPTTESTEATATEAVTPPIDAPASTDMDAHAGHDMADSEMPVDDTHMTDMLKDYTKSMASMHDEMMIGMSYNDPDTAFAKSMLGHHRGAVDMAKIELKHGTDDLMRQLAQEIIDAQQAEIDILRKWLASHLDAANPKPETQAMQQAFAKGMETMNTEMMLGIADPIPDMAFARGMLPHHISAVDMAKVQLKYGKDEEMRTLAQTIIDAQQPEIDRMQNWIAAYHATHPVDNNIDDIADTMVDTDSPVPEKSTKTDKPAV